MAFWVGPNVQKLSIEPGVKPPMVSRHFCKLFIIKW